MNTWGLFGKLVKQKLTEEQVATLFVNTTFESVEAGWALVAESINECTGFDGPLKAARTTAAPPGIAHTNRNNPIVA